MLHILSKMVVNVYVSVSASATACASSFDSNILQMAQYSGTCIYYFKTVYLRYFFQLYLFCTTYFVKFYFRACNKYRLVRSYNSFFSSVTGSEEE